MRIGIGKTEFLFQCVSRRIIEGVNDHDDAEYTVCLAIK